MRIAVGKHIERGGAGFADHVIRAPPTRTVSRPSRHLRSFAFFDLG
jgi:hypothetical protein